MERSLRSKKGLTVVFLVVIALISIFLISKIASSNSFHSKTIQSLDEKKVTVMELTAASAGASAAISLVPGDATTPIANQIMDLSSYLLIVVGAIFLEKMLLTLTGHITFTFLIPLACLLYGIYLFVDKEILKRLAIRLVVFGIAIFMVVPISVKVSDLIENTYQTSINQTIKDASNTKFTTNEKSSSDAKENSITSKAKDAVNSLGNGASSLIKKGENMLSNFIDAIAILLITSCVIPIVVLMFFIWIIKMVFGIAMPIKKVKIRE